MSICDAIARTIELQTGAAARALVRCEKALKAMDLKLFVDEVGRLDSEARELLRLQQRLRLADEEATKA